MIPTLKGIVVYAIDRCHGEGVVSTDWTSLGGLEI